MTHRQEIRACLRRVIADIDGLLRRLDSLDPPPVRRVTHADTVEKILRDSGEPLTAKQIAHHSGVSEPVLRVVLARRSRFVKVPIDGHRLAWRVRGSQDRKDTDSHAGSRRRS